MIALTYTQGLLYLVVDVGNVHDEVHIQAKVVHHDAADDVGGHIVPRVAQVALVVDGRAAGVPAHLAGLRRVEADGGAGLEGVVDPQVLDGLAHVGAEAAWRGNQEGVARGVGWEVWLAEGTKPEFEM